jgi:hypothetical protein
MIRKSGSHYYNISIRTRAVKREHKERTGSCGKTSMQKSRRGGENA